MQLKKSYWVGLVSVIDSIPPKEHASTADIRKAVGFVDQVKGDLKDFYEKHEEFNQRRIEILKPFQEKFDAIIEPDKAKRDEYAKLLDVEAQKLLNPLNQELEAFLKEQGETDLNIDIDKNYSNFLKNIFDKQIRPKIVSNKVVLAIADAFGI